MAAISGNLYNLAFDEGTDGLELIDKFGTEAIKISNIIHNSKSTSITSVCDRVIQKIEDIRSGHSTIGLPTGLCIDELMNGLCAPDLTIIAARPGMGKTALAITKMLNICSNGTPASFFSLEMSEDQLLMRMLSVVSGLPHSMIRNPASMGQTELERVYQASKNIKQMPIYIDDTAGISIQHIRSRAIRMKKEFDIKALFVDYLQLVSPGEMQRGRSRDNELGVISKGLKHIAKELNIPVVALSQLSREVEKRGGRPKLSDLRESGNIEQDADNVIFLHQPNRVADLLNDVNIVDIELILEKQRSGSTGIRKVQFVRHCVEFRNSINYDYGQPLNDVNQKHEPF
jgi:replicative DNA helicase